MNPFDKSKKSRQKSTHLYVLKAGERIKIGVTNDIESRVKSIQTGNPDKVEILFVEERLNPTKAERYLHRCFAKNRLEGEWFKDITLNQIRSRLMIFFDQD